MNKNQVAKLIHDVFDTYAASFERSLNQLGIRPWTDEKTVIHEFNLVHRFLDAYQKTGKNIDTWMELPVYYKDGHQKPQLAHIDAFIVDADRKLVFFIEAKRLSNKDQVTSLRNDVDRLFELSHEIYVGDGSFKGINLFEYDAYMIPLADIWDHRGKWCKELADNWHKKAHEFESIYSYTLTTMINSLKVKGGLVEGQYHLVGSLLPVFDSEVYKQEVIIEGHEFSPASSKSILVWADEVGFERLLAAVNKSKKNRRAQGLNV